MKSKLFAVAIASLLITCGILGGCTKTPLKNIDKVAGGSLNDTTSIDTSSVDTTTVADTTTGTGVIPIKHSILGTWKIISIKDYQEGVLSKVTTKGCKLTSTYTFKSPNIFLYSKTSCGTDKSYSGTFSISRQNKLETFRNGSTMGSGTSDVLEMTDSTFVLFYDGGQNWSYVKFKKQ